MVVAAEIVSKVSDGHEGLAELEMLVKTYLSNTMSNNNLYPAAWNLWYQVREKVELSDKNSDQDSKYTFYRTAVELLIRLFGEHTQDGETILFHSLIQEKNNELRAKGKTELVIDDSQRSKEELIAIINSDTTNGLSVLLAFLTENSLTN